MSGWRGARCGWGQSLPAWQRLFHLSLILLLLCEPVVGEGAADPDAATDLVQTSSSAVAAVEQAKRSTEAFPPEGCSNATDKEKKAKYIIVAGSVLAAVADGSLAQFPGLGLATVPLIQAAMIASIGALFGCYIERGIAMSIATALAGEQVKAATLTHLVGWLPGIGNLVKSSLAFSMTSGVGYLSLKALSCGKGIDGLLEGVSLNESDAEMGNHMQRQLFNLFSDFIQGISPEDGMLQTVQQRAGDVWQQARRAFEAPDLEQILAEIDKAEGPDALGELLQRYSWNLQAATKVLQILEDRHPTSACQPADFVARSFWVSPTADMEARVTVASYLVRCLPSQSVELRMSISQAATRSVVNARTRGADATLLLNGALELLETALGSRAGASCAIHRVGSESSCEQASNITMDEWLGFGQLSAILDATFLLLSLKEVADAACKTLRSLLRVAAEQEDSTAADWVDLRRLQRLERVHGAALCAPALRLDFLDRLTLKQLPSSAEEPESSHPPGASWTTGMPRLQSALVGQSCMLARLTSRPGYVRLRYKGMWRKDMPLVLLLTGPSGTGKTMLARTVAEVLLGRPVAELEASGRFRTFHMNLFQQAEDQNSFFGPPRGIQGSGDLPELMKEWPNAVVLLDEIEKAHSSFGRAFLKVFGENGAVYDPKSGRDFPTTNATFILTSNLGADLIRFHPVALAKVQGTSSAPAIFEEEDADLDCGEYRMLHDDLLEEMAKPRISGRENFFRESELRGRLTDVLPFLPFSPGEVGTAVRRFLAEESRTFSKDPSFKYLTLAWEPGVVPLLGSGYGRRPEQGLRGVQRDLQGKVREILEAAITLGLIPEGATVLLRAPSSLNGDALDLRVLPRLRGHRHSKPAVEPASVAVSPEPAQWGCAVAVPAGLRRALGCPDSELAVVQQESQQPEPGLPGTPTVSGGSTFWQIDWKKDWQQEWNYQWLWSFLYEWRMELMFLGVFLMGAVLSTALVANPGFIGPKVAAAAVPLVPGWLRHLSTAASVASSSFPLMVTGWTWWNRERLQMLVWCALSVLTAAITWSLWMYVHRFLDSKLPIGAASNQSTTPGKLLALAPATTEQPDKKSSKGKKNKARGEASDKPDASRRQHPICPSPQQR